MKKKVIILSVVVLLLAFSLFYAPNNMNSKKKVEVEEINYCDSDRECTIIRPSCCGCSAGGQAAAINKAYLNFWNDKLLEDCKDVGCAAVMSDHWTCFAEPKCINNKCELIER